MRDRNIFTTHINISQIKEFLSSCKYLKLILVFVALSIIPLFFIGSAHIIINDINKEARKIAKDGFKRKYQIEPTEEQLNAEVEWVFESAYNLAKKKGNKGLLWVHYVNLIRDLNKYVFYTKLLIALTLFSTLLICFLSFISYINRLFLLISFKIGLFVTISISSISVLSQSILLAGVIYYLMSHFMHAISLKLLFIIVSTGVLASLSLIANYIRKINGKQIVTGYPVQKSEQQELWEFVEKIANSVGTKMPDNVMLGLGDNYYVSQSGITYLSGELKGKTLFISLSCLYRFTQEELEAIIVHELSHFKGGDTFYTFHFYPTWRKAENVLNVAIKPVRFLLVSFMNLFQLSEAKFSKKREKIADLNAGKLTSNKTMACALVKLSFFLNFWNMVEKESVSAISNNQYIINKDDLFNHIIDNSDVKMEDIKKILETSTISHPMDSHPSLFERLYYLGVDLDDILKELYLSHKDKNATFLIKNIHEIEENLSFAEYKQQIPVDR
ncbi:hypothetical protein AGMMS50233_03600 [Endomicrobiia bacterium]|nr:hypothetical protein AGMMS50233_03600 [Endomicrobiia bacterium]